MAILERKNHLHQLVAETNDDVILERIELLFEELLNSSALDWSDTISDQERKAIEAGKIDSQQGRTISHEEVKKKALSILNK